MTDRAEKLRRDADEATAEAMRRIQDSGELSHLYGQPLDLDDDPDWLVNRVLKQQGFSHPIIERRRELDEPRRAADALADRLGRRYRRALAANRNNGGAEARAFNEWRAPALEELREKLFVLNRAIRDYNLQAPEGLHQRPVSVEDAIARIAREAPPIDLASSPSQPHARSRSFWRRLCSKL